MCWNQNITYNRSSIPKIPYNGISTQGSIGKSGSVKIYAIQLNCKYGLRRKNLHDIINFECIGTAVTESDLCHIKSSRIREKISNRAERQNSSRWGRKGSLVEVKFPISRISPNRKIIKLRVCAITNGRIHNTKIGSGFDTCGYMINFCYRILAPGGGFYDQCDGKQS